MGGHIRVNTVETDLLHLITSTANPVYAATLQGDNVYAFTQPKPGIILIGNESKGLSDELIAAASHKLTIPGKGGAESLNAAVSAGILCALLIRG
jgi:TrmH family RNA methyltransferase